MRLRSWRRSIKLSSPTYLPFSIPWLLPRQWMRNSSNLDFDISVDSSSTSSKLSSSSSACRSHGTVIMGESDNYYNPQGNFQQQQQGNYQQGNYQQQQQQGYQQNAYPPQPPQNSYQQPQNASQQPPQNGYQQPPPENGFAPQQYSGDEKGAFEQQFKVQKPKWNDLWAGILVCSSWRKV